MELDERLKGALLGAVGGAAGTWVMGMLMAQMKRLAPKEERATPQGEDDASISLVGRQYRRGEGSTQALGRILYTSATSEEPSKETAGTLSGAVHWGFGISMGALYGVLRPHEDAPDLPAGLAFGTAVWIFASELMVPLLGLAAAPAAVPLRQHAGHMVAHLVYGGVTSAVAQGLRTLTLAESPPPPGEGTRPSAMRVSEQPVPMEEATRMSLTRFGGSL